MFTLEQIAAFVAAAETGSFSAGARRLGRSQSSVSIGINNLEIELGVALFDRSGKYPVLTDTGRQLFQQGQILLRQVGRMSALAQSVQQQVEDKLVLGLGPMVPISILEASLEKLGRHFPNTVINLVRDANQRLHEKLIAGEVDLVLQVVQKAVPDHLDFKGAGLLEWVCVCSPDFEFADMNRVDNEALLVTRQLYLAAMTRSPLLAELSAMSQDVWTVTDQEDLVRLVEQGLGWAFMPLALLREREPLGTLVRFTPEFQTDELLVPLETLLRPSFRQGPALSYFLQLTQALGRC